MTLHSRSAALPALSDTHSLRYQRSTYSSTCTRSCHHPPSDTTRHVSQYSSALRAGSQGRGRCCAIYSRATWKQPLPYSILSFLCVCGAARYCQGRGLRWRRLWLRLTQTVCLACIIRRVFALFGSRACSALRYTWGGCHDMKK